MNTLDKTKPLKKTEQITESLRQLVQSVGPDAKLPTYLELLSSLSVSRTTLNAALSELESQRVIYRRHGVGIFSASQQRTQSIALLCNPLFFQSKTQSPFWDVLLEGARERAESDDFSCEIHFCKTQDYDVLPFSDNLLNSLQLGHLSGVMGVGMNRATHVWLKERGIHYVSFGGPGSWHIGLDNAAIIQQGVEALSRRGCQRIGLLSPLAPYKNYSQFQEQESLHTKIEVFRMALAHHHLPFERDRVAMNLHWVMQQTDSMTTWTNQEQGYHCVHQFFANGSAEVPDGLLFTDDVMAKGGMAALRELHLQPGHDVQIATHANRGTEVLLPYENVMTRMEIDPGEIVDTLFSTIRDLVEGRQPTGYNPSSISDEMDKRIEPIIHHPQERNQ